MDPNEFLNDPRFPNRPNTPDFWRLSESILANDATAKQQGVEAVLEDLVDLNAAVYMGIQRAGQIGMLANPLAVSLWLDGLALGIKFAQAGGHRD